jgi:hypothetical protein
MALSDKQQAFVNEYLKCWNATEAARRAGYKNPNKRGPENVVKSGIAEEIATRKAALIMSADEVLTRLTDMGRGSLADFADVKTGADLKAHPLAHLVHKLETRGRKTKDGDIFTWVKIELHNSQHALVTLAKINGILSDQHVVTVRLEQELNALLDIAQKVLSEDYYEKLLSALAGNDAAPG